MDTLTTQTAKRYTGMKVIAFITAALFIIGFLSIFNFQGLGRAGSIFGITVYPPISSIVAVVDLAVWFGIFYFVWSKKRFGVTITLLGYVTLNYVLGTIAILGSDQFISLIAQGTGAATIAIGMMVIYPLFAVWAFLYVLRNKEYFNQA